jgi:hypothetical protein
MQRSSVEGMQVIRYRIAVEFDFQLADQWKCFFVDDLTHVHHRVEISRSGAVVSLVAEFVAESIDQTLHLPNIAFDMRR